MAKEHVHVTVVCDSADSAAFTEEWRRDGRHSQITRLKLAGKVFALTGANEEDQI
jgi:AICAR transformylase/IMP cyclohydrolase PurH